MTPNASQKMAGALAGLRVVEFAGIGPAPFAGMMLADMGADVVVIDRISAAQAGYPPSAMNRGKKSIALDLHSESAKQVAWRLIERADILIEGFRPGVMERLGFSPDSVAARNPKLVFGRVTGWGQEGPLAQSAGHDINYVALSGILSISRDPNGTPAIPATIIGDMAGGAMFLCFGLLCAVLEAQRTGHGQAVDASMLDGVVAMSGLIHQMRGVGYWQADPRRNFFLNTSPFYGVFECQDGKFISIGAIEPQFYKTLLTEVGVDGSRAADQYDATSWPKVRGHLSDLFRQHPRDYWCSRLEGTDACFAPVLSLEEAPQHPHNQARALFRKVGAALQPAPAPRLSRSRSRAPGVGARNGEHTRQILAELGFSASEVQNLERQRACMDCNTGSTTGGDSFPS